MTRLPDCPPPALDPAAWERAARRLVETLRDLIRIPSINPPGPAGGELRAAAASPAALGDAGSGREVFEPVPGRGSVVARLRGDGTGGAPLLLLCHLDVVPAPPERLDPRPVRRRDRRRLDLRPRRRGHEGPRRDGAGASCGCSPRGPRRRSRPGKRPDPRPAPRHPVRQSTADEEAGGLHGRRLARRRAPGACSGRRPRSTRPARVATTSAGAASIRSGSPRRATPSTG